MNGFMKTHSAYLDNKHEKLTNARYHDLCSPGPGRPISIQAPATVPECHYLLMIIMSTCVVMPDKLLMCLCVSQDTRSGSQSILQPSIPVENNQERRKEDMGNNVARKEGNKFHLKIEFQTSLGQHPRRDRSLPERSTVGLGFVSMPALVQRVPRDQLSGQTQSTRDGGGVFRDNPIMSESTCFFGGSSVWRGRNAGLAAIARVVFSTSLLTSHRIVGKLPRYSPDL